MIFNTEIKRLSTLPPNHSEIRRQPMFYRADADYVYRLGGQFYRDILKHIPFTGSKRYISIDSRVQMLMPGWLPCIGGWHCDDFYRPTGEQPDLWTLANVPTLRSTHWAVYLGDTSPTEYAGARWDIPVLWIDTNAVYQSLHTAINRMTDPETFHSNPGEIVQFGSLDFHRGTKATKAGWRLFFRATESNVRPPLNEIRTQTQIYIESEAAGW